MNSSVNQGILNDTIDGAYEMYEGGVGFLGERYQYVGRIQEGSFGKVTLAVDLESKQKVAVKAMYKSRSKHMAEHEVKVLTMLGQGSENICQLMNYFETDKFIILILEYCANGDMYDLIHSATKLSSMDVWNLAKEISAGLKYAHSKGVFHRDIKPENVLFTREGTIKLCDWGLSTTRRFNDEFNIGTERYMAPECFIKRDDFNKYDAKFADFWSLGVTLLTAVFGNSPFRPVGESNSLASDSNFKNFVEFNNPLVLYDIYPDMNPSCFKIFMHLLKASGRNSDLKNYRQTIRSRNLELFLKDFEEHWSLGLTIDDDYSMDDVIDTKQELFDMDDDIGPFVGRHSHGYFSESETDNFDSNVESISFPIDIKRRSRHDFSSTTSAGLPSLVDSSINSSKSWCDFDEDDEDEFEKIFNRLSMSKNPSKNKMLRKDLARSDKSNVLSLLGSDLSIHRNANEISLFD